MKKAIHWAAIRETNGETWIDIHSISNDKGSCKIKAVEMNRSIPTWAKDNPIKFVAEVETKLI